MISVIVPVHNEEDNVLTLIQEIVSASKNAPIKEIIYVDDGSRDKTCEKIERLMPEIPMLRLLKHGVCAGQSAALMTGVRAAREELIVMMDGDGQNDPADIAKLYTTYQDNAAKHEKLMVSGLRAKRHDNALRRISSRLANHIRSSFLQDGTKDTGCSLKLIRREDYLKLPYFKHMHRFLAALLKRDQVASINIPVAHRPRTAGISKYGFWNRFWVGIVDLFGVKWLMIRGLPPAFSIQEIQISTQTEKVLAHVR